ncbi:MAG: DedA family protein [Chloroherpetonaceae bacterium]|nr:DedA family protein [Chloroherpetonaceae bacterium]MDW8438502.1 DedA family protein [Chloroherpetonaceae bacterium]
MLEEFVRIAQSLDSAAIYLFLFVIAYLENVIPPIPGDLPVAFVGSLLATSDLSFFGCVFSASTGSALGFFTMYGVGRFIGERLYDEGDGAIRRRWVRLTKKVFPPEQFAVVSEQFSRYGYWLIVANRFLTGSRAVISIVAGMSRLNVVAAHACAFASAVLWNVLLVYGGYLLGTNWKKLGDYISAYGGALTVVVLVVFALLVWRAIRKRRQPSNM